MKSLFETIQNTALNAIVIIKAVDFYSRTFHVVGKRLMSRTVLGKKYPWVDILIEEDLKPENSYRLRYTPTDNEQTVNVALLSLYDSFPWNHDFEVLMQEEWFKFDDDGRIFRRINEDVHTPNEAWGYWQKDSQEGSVSLSYWDRWRVIGDTPESGTEFCFVERDATTKMFEIWVGPELSQYAVELI